MRDDVTEVEVEFVEQAVFGRTNVHEELRIKKEWLSILQYEVSTLESYINNVRSQASTILALGLSCERVIQTMAESFEESYADYRSTKKRLVRRVEMHSFVEEKPNLTLDEFKRNRQEPRRGRHTEHVFGLLSDAGMTVGEIVAKSSLTEMQVRNALRHLIHERRVETCPTHHKRHNLYVPIREKMSVP